MAETSDTEMVIRVARAISGAPFPTAASRRKAEAAIRAMREPTARMVSEGESAASVGIGKPIDDEALPRVWRDMIDAALPSPPDPR